MTTTILIAINAVLDAAILGGVAFAMSRAARLKPHPQSTAAPRTRLQRRHEVRRPQAAPVRLRGRVDARV
jgi:hypothetical protein